MRILLLCAFVASACGIVGGPVASGPILDGGAEGYVFFSASAPRERSADGTRHEGIALGREAKAPDGFAPATGEVTVVSAPAGEALATEPTARAKPSSDGLVKLEKLPAGTYRLRAAAADGRTADFPLTVFGGATVRWGAYPVTRDTAFESAKRTVASAIRPDETFVVSPPTPLPSGVKVEPALGNDDGERVASAAYTTTSAQWLFYVDPFSATRFQHPTKFVFVDAESGAVTERDAGSWPLVNGLSYYGNQDTLIDSPDLLLSPARRPGPRPTSRDSTPLANALRGLLRAALDHVPGCTTSTTHALLIAGADEGPINADMRNVKNVFGRGGIPPALVYEWKPVPGNSPVSEVQAMWGRIKAAATECDHVFVMISAHGNRNGTVQLETDRRNRDGSPKIYESFSLKNLDWGNCRACHITIVIDSCFSGKMLQDLIPVFTPLTGRKVTIMTASDARHEAGSYAWWNPKGATGGAFTNAFLTAFAAETAASGGSPVSLGRTFDRANVEVASTVFSSAIREQNPQYWERRLQPGETCRALSSSPSPATVTSSPTSVGRAPDVGPIRAVLRPPSTFYTVTATDPDGDALTFRWTNTNSCGTFTSGGAQATWEHPHPPCGNEPVHSGTITVDVSDGRNTVRRTYDRGSAEGVGTDGSSGTSSVRTTAHPAQYEGTCSQYIVSFRWTLEGAREGDPMVIRVRKGDGAPIEQRFTLVPRSRPSGGGLTSGAWFDPATGQFIFNGAGDVGATPGFSAEIVSIRGAEPSGERISRAGPNCQ